MECRSRVFITAHMMTGSKLLATFCERYLGGFFALLRGNMGILCRQVFFALKFHVNQDFCAIFIFSM